MWLCRIKAMRNLIILHKNEMISNDGRLLGLLGLLLYSRLGYSFGIL